MDPYVILGCGYVGTRLCRALLAEGRSVRVCARRVALLQPLRELGADVHYLDAGRPRSFGPALRGLPQPVVLYSVPGVPNLPAGEAVRRAADAALQVQARAFIYLSTTGVYGRNELSSNDEWVDEDSAVDLHDPDMGSRLGDEAAVAAVKMGGLRTIVLRLAAIYGPGRGVRARMRRGEYKLWDGGRYYFSRIHIDDLVAVIRAAAERAPQGAVYAVGDDHPCPQGEYGRWLATHLGLPEPPSLDSLRPEAPRQVIRGRRIKNRLMKEQLGIVLRYPGYMDGERQIDEEEGAGEAAPQTAADPPPLPVIEAPVADPGWPFVLGPAADVGTAIGIGQTGVALRTVAAGGVDREGARIVLSGAPEVTWAGRCYRLCPPAIVPPEAVLRNPGPGEVLLLVLPSR